MAALAASGATPGPPIDAGGLLLAYGGRFESDHASKLHYCSLGLRENWDLITPRPSNLSCDVPGCKLLLVVKDERDDSTNSTSRIAIVKVNHKSTITHHRRFEGKLSETRFTIRPRPWSWPWCSFARRDPLYRPR